MDEVLDIHNEYMQLARKSIERRRREEMEALQTGALLAALEERKKWEKKAGSEMESDKNFGSPHIVGKDDPQDSEDKKTERTKFDVYLESLGQKSAQVLRTQLTIESNSLYSKI